jgi:hypothetical protein
MQRILLPRVELLEVVARDVQVEMVAAAARLVVRVVLERQLHEHVPDRVGGLVAAAAAVAADAEVRGQLLAELAHEAEIARVAGQAVLGLAEAGVVVDELAAVGVREEEQAGRFGRGCGLGAFADREVGDGRLLEVGDGGASGVEDGGPGVVDWGRGDERVGRGGPAVGVSARVGFGWTHLRGVWNWLDGHVSHWQGDGKGPGPGVAGQEW